jgi:uncharacterized protein (DUF849 family)
VLLKACLNGGRSREEHPAVPLTPDEIARDAAAAVAAGAGAVHVHPRDGSGAETLDPAACAATVTALRPAGVPVGLSTGLWIEGTASARLAEISRWHVLPDFVSVNVYEEGAAELCDLLAARGVGLEAGLATVEDVSRMPSADWLRVLVEVEEPEPSAAVAAAASISAALRSVGVSAPQLHHGEGVATWAVLKEAIKGGFDVRVGLEDTLVLPDGRVARDNAELVSAALSWIGVV